MPRLARLQQVRASRDEAKVQDLLEKLKAVARDESQNIVPVTVELVREGASMGDIVETLKTVWGTYRETPMF
jgi:methylmalonyl-CoA mutase N-terminal domain/subunit